jgi:hypothetical protein
MKIPVHIVEQGGEMLELYIKYAKELDGLENKRIALQEKIKLNMVNVNKTLKDYLPETDREMAFIDGRPKEFDSYTTRKIIAHVEQYSNKVNLDFLSAIELLKVANLHILDLKEKKHQITNLKDKLVLIERGEYRDWLHGDN